VLLRLSKRGSVASSGLEKWFFECCNSGLGVFSAYIFDLKYDNVRREIKMEYFVKNLKVHKHPVPSTCNVQYTNEHLYYTPPAGYEKCDNCFTELPR
jgi:hypothetical protein